MEHQESKRNMIPIKVYVLFLISFMIGAAVLAYPPFSSWWNIRHQKGVAASYVAEMEAISPQDYSAYFEDARAYNERILSNTAILTDPFDYESAYQHGEDYFEMLSVTDAMAIIEIPIIDVKLPVYHGTETETLEKGIGHLEGSSLPVGGIGTNSILTGHTGLPGNLLFTNLIKLKEKDVFYLYVLNEEHVYQVDNISVILPNEFDKISISKDNDYVTLITCTPYGVNDHRLLVRGMRIFPDTMSGEEKEAYEQALNQGKALSPIEKLQLIAAAVAVILFLIMLFMMLSAIRYNRKMKWSENREPSGSQTMGNTER